MCETLVHPGTSVSTDRPGVLGVLKCETLVHPGTSVSTDRPGVLGV